MTVERIKVVCSSYRFTISSRGIIPVEPERLEDGSRGSLTDADGDFWSIEAQHILWMLDEIVEFARHRRLDKAFRWLGFVQGWLWARGLYSIDELKRHNMPGEGES